MAMANGKQMRRKISIADGTFARVSIYCGHEAREKGFNECAHVLTSLATLLLPECLTLFGRVADNWGR